MHKYYCLEIVLNDLKATWDCLGAGLKATWDCLELSKFLPYLIDYQLSISILVFPIES